MPRENGHPQVPIFIGRIAICGYSVRAGNDFCARPRPITRAQALSRRQWLQVCPSCLSSQAVSLAPCKTAAFRPRDDADFYPLPRPPGITPSAVP